MFMATSVPSVLQCIANILYWDVGQTCCVCRGEYWGHTLFLWPQTGDILKSTFATLRPCLDFINQPNFLQNTCVDAKSPYLKHIKKEEQI